MYNTANPAIHFVVEAGSTVEVQTPGSYAFAPIDVQKLIANNQNFQAGKIAFNTSNTTYTNMTSNSQEEVVNNNQANEQSIPVNSTAGTLPEEALNTPLQPVSHETDPLFTTNLMSIIEQSRLRI